MWVNALKELEHRKVGTYLRIYNLDKSLGKEIWCKMAETHTKIDNIF